MPFDYSLVVIGAGSGGLAAAERAAAYGVRVAIAERAAVGGACINYGCIPEKLLDYAASYRERDQIASSYGWNAIEPHLDWSHFVKAKNQHIQHLNQLHLHNLQTAGVDFITGQAAFLDAHTVVIGDRPVTADKILIAVGAKPVKPSIPGMEQAITWHELYNLAQQPQQIAVLGGDPIGVKVAGSLNELGSQVTQIIAEDCILSELDAEVAQAIQHRMQQRGVKVLNQTQVKEIQPHGEKFHLSLSSGNATSLDVDTVFVDAPRRPNLTGLNLEKVGLELTASGALRVDQFSRTTQPNVFAVGDCTERIPLTPNAIAQAKAFADTEFGKRPQSVSYKWLPVSVASYPEAATVGMSEAQARKQFGDAVSCYRTEFRPLFYCLAQANERCLLKVVTNQQDSERVLGISWVGNGAVEIIQSLALALKLGATKQDLDSAIGIHPSLAEELFAL